MVDAATGTFGNVDLLLLLAEAGAAPHPDDRFIIESLERLALPVFLVINKIDLVEKRLLLPLIDSFRSLHPFREIIPLSALERRRRGRPDRGDLEAPSRRARSISPRR